MKKYLSIDLGATSGKAILTAFDGKQMKLKEVHRFPNTPFEVNGVVYWDVLGLYGNILKSIEESLKKVGQVKSLGIDTWGVDFGLLDENGFLLGNPFHYRNAYKTDTMQEILKDIGKEWIFRRSPTQFQPFNTLYQLIYLKKSNFAALSIARTLLGMPALLSYFLSGERVMEFTYATTTQLYNPFIGKWDEEIIEKFHLPDILPSVIPPSTKIGKFEYNGKKMNVVAVASHDTASAFASTGVEDEETMIISSGTWFLEGVVTDKIYNDTKILKYNFANEGCIDGKYRVLANVTGMWIIEQLMRKWKKKNPRLNYFGITKLAKSSTPFKGFVDVDSKEFQNPFDMEKTMVNECKAFCGSELETVGEITRAVFESLAFKTRWVKERLEEITKKKIGKIRMIGGVTRNDFMCQLISNATGVPLVAGPVEGTSVGNALSQIVADREAKLEDFKDILENSFELKSYFPQDEKVWNEVYQKYASLQKR